MSLTSWQQGEWKTSKRKGRVDPVKREEDEGVWGVKKEGGLQGRGWRPVVRPDCCLAGCRSLCWTCCSTSQDVRQFYLLSAHQGFIHSSCCGIARTTRQTQFDPGEQLLITFLTFVWGRISWRQNPRLCQGCCKGRKVENITQILCFSIAVYFLYNHSLSILSSSCVGNVSADLFKRLSRVYLCRQWSIVGWSGARDTSRSQTVPWMQLFGERGGESHTKKAFPQSWPTVIPNEV